MGYGGYDVSRRAVSTQTKGYDTKSAEEIFSRSLHESMDPKNIRLRECRDSDDHPDVVPIVLALDVTGSMGRIPHHLIKEGLPKLMSKLLERCVDASLLFMAVGDHIKDSHPLQVGQFESSDELLDTWLERTYLECGGGGNRIEGYFLPWYFAARHVEADAFDKGRKGILFTVGDEGPPPVLSIHSIKEIFGSDYDAGGENLPIDSILELVKKKFDVFHINVRDGNYGSIFEKEWGDLLGNGSIYVNKYTEIPDLIVDVVSNKSSKVDRHKEEVFAL